MDLDPTMMPVNDPTFINFPTHSKTLSGFPDLFVRSSERAPVSMRGRLHRHTFYEINWLASGKATLFSDFARFPVEAGALVITVPGQLHTWEGDWDNFTLYVFGFTPDFLTAYPQHSQFLNELPIRQDSSPYIQTEAEQRTGFEHLFVSAMGRYDSARTCDGLDAQQSALIGSYLNVILMEAQLVYVAEGLPQTTNAATQLTQQFRLAVETSYLERKKVRDYAEELGVTDNHLVESVAAVTGMTPGQIIHQRLLLEAKRLLVHTPSSVAQIANTLAFPSPSHFGRWFKNLADTTPRQFRTNFVHIS